MREAYIILAESEIDDLLRFVQNAIEHKAQSDYPLAEVYTKLWAWLKADGPGEYVGTSMQITPHVLEDARGNMREEIRRHMLYRLANELMPRLVDGEPHLVQLIRDEEIPPKEFYDPVEKVLEVLVKQKTAWKGDSDARNPSTPKPTVS